MITLRNNEKLNPETILKLVGKIEAIIYVRVSSVDQIKKYSLGSQVEECKKLAFEKFGIKDDQLITMIEEGEMGDNPNRPALNHALHLLESGLGSKLIALHPDRLARDVTIQGMVSKKVWGLGADIEFVEFEIDPTNPESVFMYNIQGAVAQYNKAKILANSRRGRLQKAKRGEIPSFRRLYGYRHNKETQKLEINEDEYKILLLMKDLLLEKDYSCNQIAIELSKRSIPAPNGKIWYQATVTRILRNESYTGVYYHGRTRVIQKNGERKQVPTPRENWIPIEIPQIFDEETFDEIQEKISGFTKNKGRKSNTHLLKGIARCGRCGSAAGSGTASKVKSGIYKYYACRKKASKGYKVGTGENINVCKGRNWRVDIVDEIVWEWLIKTLENPVSLAEEMHKLFNDDSSIEELKKKEKSLINQIEKVEREEDNYLLLFGKGKITEEKYDQFTQPLSERKEMLDEELKIVSNQLSSIKNKANEIDKITEYANRISKTLNSNEMDIEERRKIVRFFIHKVVLYDDDTVEIVSKWGDHPLDDEDKKTLDNRQRKRNNLQTYGG